MTAYTLNLPDRLKQEIEQLAQSQGISLNQFLLWAVTEKVSKLKTSFSPISIIKNQRSPRIFLFPCLLL